MQAIEFEAVPYQNSIRVPKQIPDGVKLRVLVLMENNQSTQNRSSAAVTLALLRTPTFQSLPKADPQEIEQRIASLREDWGDE